MKTADARTRVIEAMTEAEVAAKAAGGGPGRLKQAVTDAMVALVEATESEGRELVRRAHGSVAWAVKCSYDDAYVACHDLRKPFSEEDRDKAVKQQRNAVLEEAARVIQQRRDDALRGVDVPTQEPSP